MKRTLFAVLLLSLIAFSCSAPEPPYAAPAVPELAVQDSIPTIVLSSDTTPSTPVVFPIEMELGSEGLHITDGRTIIDRLGEVHSVLIKIDADTIVSVDINKAVAVNSNTEWSPPFYMLDANHVKLKEGATLELVARYYNKTVVGLKYCNNLSSDYITAGQVLKLSCCGECK